LMVLIDDLNYMNCSIKSIVYSLFQNKNHFSVNMAEKLFGRIIKYVLS